MYRKSSATDIAIVSAVWSFNVIASAIAIVLLTAILRGAGAAWMSELSFWQAIILRLLFKSLSSDMFKVSLRN